MFTRGVNQLSAAIIALVAILTSPFTTDVQANDAILIEFSSDQCRSCQAMKPLISQLERQGIPVRHVNVGGEPDLARRYGIAQTPTYVILSGGRELTRLVGAQSMQQLQQAMAINPNGPRTQTRADLNQRPSSRLAATGPGAANTNSASHRIPPARRDAFNPRDALNPAAPNPPTAPPISIDQAIAMAQAATVRLKVYDDRGYGAGTGTIIDTHDGEALVMTCGHLFRDTQGRGKIDVEIFSGGQIKTVVGNVVDYDADDRDVALVAIQPGFEVTSVKVLPAGEVPQTGQSVFSFGCDHGQEPSRRDTRIIGVDQFNAHLRALNLEIQGAPVDGRSGGGLFDSQGRLIGVCNAADYKTDKGYYAGPGSIHWQLDRIQLSHLYQRQVSSPNDSQPLTRLAVTPALQSAPRMQQSAPKMQPPPGMRPQPNFDPNVMQASATDPVGPTSQGVSHAVGDQEVIVVVRNPNQPDQNRVMTIRQPSAEFMQMLHSQSR